jgi:O-antigen ligase
MVATLLAFIFLPPDQLIERFAQLASSDHFKSETRLQLWKETLRLLSDYPVFGCGAGGYESAFLTYQDVVPLTAVEYAHNDYLQWVAELGVIGFLIAAALVALFVHASVLAWRSHPTPAGRMVALACFASFAALLIHSIVEFQSFIPANALMMSWIAGIASSLTIEWEPISMNDLFGRPAVITVSVTSAR